MIEEIIALKRSGLSFRKIAKELNTSVGKVQYQWVKLINHKKVQKDDRNIEGQQHSIRHVQNNHLTMSLISPQQVFLQWHVCMGTKELVKQFFHLEDINLALRLNDVTCIIYDGSNAHSAIDIGITNKDSHWILSGLKSNHCYVAEIGVLLSNLDFFPLVKSNAIHVPRNSTEQTGHLGHDVQQFLMHSNQTPNWVEHVSTYSYYEKELKENE
ncbi:DUF4912 domain-containing protein [Cytobacillus gottheilii]|uniref:DUF4912 domain-containing protein n=1 Tax=Cytobacillus gottheilii TaxID=859144 RepID=UPI001593D6BD|nr:DUF4912 domain-containing protein [Cytobacillus gottheilii]